MNNKILSIFLTFFGVFLSLTSMITESPNVSIERVKYVDKNEADSEQRIRKKEKE